jgi:MurNAc alpha-1-phosphate uridylyltransferase
MLPVVVLAGGLGTRVASLTGDRVPKALLPVAGRPFIDHKIDELVGHGVTDVVLLVGHRAQAMVDHVGDGSRYGIGVRCIEDGPTLLGTGGAVRAALDELPEAFWIAYGDTLLSVPMAEVEELFLTSGAGALMTVLHNRDEVQPSNVTVADGRVVAYRKGDPPGTHEYIDYGLLLLSAELFRPFPPGQAFDLGELLRPAVEEGRVAAYVVDAPFHDIGTPEALSQTDALLRED